MLRTFQLVSVIGEGLFVPAKMMSAVPSLTGTGVVTGPDQLPGVLQFLLTTPAFPVQVQVSAKTGQENKSASPSDKMRIILKKNNADGVLVIDVFGIGGAGVTASTGKRRTAGCSGLRKYCWPCCR